MVRRTVTASTYPTQTLEQRRVLMSWRKLLVGAFVVTLVATAAVVFTPLSETARALAFRGSVVDAGSPATLAPGATTQISLRFRNTGLTTWQVGDPKSQVYLGVRGDSIEFARAGMAVGWLSESRIATTTESTVSPGSVGTFTFGVRAPATLGIYRVPVRLVVDDVTWLEDDGLFVVVASDFGFHGELIDQSRHPILRVGETSAPITVKLRNTGTRAWVRGTAGEQVNLGLDGADPSLTALASGWPSADRVAIQAEKTVAPGDVATFVFRVRAPSTPGTYALRLRGVVDGVTWLEGDGVMSLITVTAASGQTQQQPATAGAVSFTSSASVSPTSVSAGESANISAAFTSSAATTALVGVEINTPEGATLAYQKWFEGQSFASGESRSFPVSWQVPSTATLGTYTVTLRAFAPGWKTLLGAQYSATTFSVSAPVAAAPAATPAPGTTNAPAATLAAVTAGSPAPEQAAAAAGGAANRKPTPTPTIAPAPSFTTSASVASSTIAPNSWMSAVVSFTSATAMNVNLIAAVYAPGGALAVQQQSFNSQSFTSGQQRNYTVGWLAPADAVLGTYRVGLGVYSLDWVTEYKWTESAVTFIVAAPSPTATPTTAPTTSPAPTATAVPTSAPTASATPTPAPTAVVTPTPAPTATAAPLPVGFTTSASVSPASVTVGGAVSITVLVTSNTAIAALVDIGVYAPNGTTRVRQQWYDDQVFAAGQQRSYAFTWTVPTTSAAGTYKVTVGVFSPAWGSLYTWQDRATFTVGAAATPSPTPAPTPAPTATPAPPTPAPTATPLPPTPAPTATPLPPTPAPTATPGTPSFSGLRVQGNRLVNDAGQQVILHGVDRMGTEYRCSQDNGIFDGPSDQASIAAIKSWRTNAIRVPLNEHCWLGIDDGAATPQYIGENYRLAIEGFVDRLIANNIYVILDLHWSAAAGQSATDQDEMPNTSYSASFWNSVANRFKNKPQVIFDLFNEPIPNGNANDNTDAAAAASWQCWRDGSAGGTCTGPMAGNALGMQALVSAVRATGATNVIMLGGIQWANTLWSSSTRNFLTYKPADPLNNIVASFHIYQNTWCNTVACFDTEIPPIAAQVPVVAAEIGNTACDATFMNMVMNWLDSKQLGYLAWVWNNYGATSCANIMLILDYSGTPSAYGQIYKSHLALLP